MFRIIALRSEEFNRYVDNSSHTVISVFYVIEKKYDISNINTIIRISNVILTFLSKILAHRILKRGGSLQRSGDPSGPSGAGTRSGSEARGTRRSASI